MSRLSSAVWLRGFKLKPLACFIFLTAQLPHYAFSQDEFDMAALETSGPKVHVDLSQFSNLGSQLPGKYRVDVFIDHEQVDTRELDFTQDKKGQLTPTLTPALLKQWGVEVNSIPGLDAMKQIANVAEAIPDSSAKLDFSQMRLDLSIPQADMDMAAQGYVSPALWDEGIPALVVGYDFNGSNTWRTDEDSASGREDSYFLSLHSGLNLGAWRLRNYSTWTYTSYPENDTASSDDNHDSDSHDDTQSHW
ncbi:MAG: FimD/PapC N-terminal domain-containing protein, partial [Hafnia alvei]|nr:FimD/PapC N-terminal domain-containing protein [Hafnia alvei]